MKSALAVLLNSAAYVWQTINTGSPVDESGDDWFKLSPFGRFPTSDRDGSTQIFEREQAVAMAEHFNSVKAKLARLFRGVPVYAGHPDFEPARWNDDRRRGKIVELAVREDGLYARAEWNDLGRENIEQGHWLYPSPAWADPNATRTSREHRPTILLSVGLTNTPNIAASEPLANAETHPTNTQEKPMKSIAERLGLDPETATEAEILEAIDALAAKASDMEEQYNGRETELTNARAELDDAETQRRALKVDLNAANVALAEARLNAAITSGRITEAERGEWATRLANNLDEATKALEALTPKLNTKPLGDGARKVDVGTAEKASAIINAAVASKMERDGLTHQAAWNAVKGDDAFAPHFAKLNEARAAA